MATQGQIEDLLRNKAKGRVTRLEYALAKLERKVSNPPGAAASESRRIYYTETKPAWENLIQQYRDELAEIKAGNYHGFNGKPFGATPGIS